MIIDYRRLIHSARVQWIPDCTSTSYEISIDGIRAWLEFFRIPHNLEENSRFTKDHLQLKKIPDPLRVFVSHNSLMFDFVD